MIKQKIDKLFELNSEAFRRRWKNKPVDFLIKKCGRKYPPKLRRYFEAIYWMRILFPILVGPRGGGKTTIFSDIATCKYLFELWDVLFLGGSKKQAQKGYKYTSDNLGIHREDLIDFDMGTLTTVATSVYGNWLKIAACATTAIRGEHAGDVHPQMNNNMSPHGGLTILDEACEVKDQKIISAAKKTMNTARPGMFLMGSTFHKLGGPFAEYCDNPNKYNATILRWDCFDITTGCDKDCRKCIPEFAGRKIPGWEEWLKRHSEFPHKRGYCEGKAKSGGGWREIWGNHGGTIERAWLEKRNISEFDIEEMGWRPPAGGKVLNNSLLPGSLRGMFDYLPGMPSLATVDWGFSGWCVIHILQKRENNEIGVLHTEYYHYTRDDVIYNRLESLQKMYHFYDVCPDASHKYQNENLISRGFNVLPVEFNKWKEFGAGWIEGLLESGRLRIQGEILNGERIFKDRNTERFYGELENWGRNSNGVIVKRDDHGPDSLLCAAFRWGKGSPWRMEFREGARREIYQMLGAGR